MRIDGISVIVTTYNGAPWIRAALTSILRQTISVPLEIIVIDDCSTDNTLEVIQSLGDDRVQIHRNEKNSGTARSRNWGIHKSRFQWLAFNDQDDVWLPEKLKLQCDIIEQNGEMDGVAGGYARLANDGQSRWETKLLWKRWSPNHCPKLDHPPTYDPAQHGTCYIQSLLIHKPVMEKIHGFREDIPIAYDPDLFLRMGEIAKLGALEQPVFLYRLSATSITGAADLDAKKFLAGFAFMYAAQAARSGGEPEPDLKSFLDNYQPTTAEIKRFESNQLLRHINTCWVGGGVGFAIWAGCKHLLTHPSLIGNLLSRLRWWARA